MAERCKMCQTSYFYHCLRSLRAFALCVLSAIVRSIRFFGKPFDRLRTGFRTGFTAGPGVVLYAQPAPGTVARASFQSSCHDTWLTLKDENVCRSAVILTARHASKMLAIRGRVILELVVMIYAHPEA